MVARLVDHLISWIDGKWAVVTDEPTKNLVLALFNELQKLESCGDDELRLLWLTAPRGEIEDFGDYDEYLEMGEVSSREEFERLWLDYYPQPVKWYKLAMVFWNGWYSVFLDNKLVLQIQPEPEKQLPMEKTDLAEWLLSATIDTVESVRSGTYNEFVRQNLPYRKKKGRILREDFWSIFSEEKTAYFENITQDDVDRFVKLMDAQPDDSPNERLPEMTAQKFFDCCRLGYEANNYKGIGELDARELYCAHADGRDDGLLDIDPNSAEDFASWYHNPEFRGGHPWEVCRGGNSTHISLYANSDENGWWFSLAGSSYGRSVETVKFYLALADAGLPTYLRDGKELADMITGRDFIGIVPEDVFPRYCAQMFTDKRIIDFMNLPYEETEAIIKASYWYPLREVRLI